MFQWLQPVINPLACLPEPPEPEGFRNAEALLARLEKALSLRHRSTLGGDKQSFMKGHGLDFAELREYVPGDEVRKIDWNVFARTMSPHIKEYREEKLLTLWLAVDLTPSMGFGQTVTKAQRAVEWAGLLGLMAASARHRLGAVIMTAEGTAIIPHQIGRTHLQHIMQKLLGAEKALRDNREPVSLPPDFLAEGLRQLAHVCGRRGILFVLSDFGSPVESWRPVLGDLLGKADLTSVLLVDPVEKALPVGIGSIPVLDAESGEPFMLDTDDRHFCREYQAAMAVRLEATRSVLQSLGVALEASTTLSPSEWLEALLAATARRKRV